MSQIKIQEYIVAEIKVNHCAHLRKGQTIQARDDRSSEKWVAFMVERGYSASEAAILFKDAHDVAMLELAA
ncbi:hypothetical protein [Pseudomonas phage vB-PaeM-YQ78]|nr:hypothetical protein [Pseudomonas phage vB-PaeM-YQ78]